MEDVRVVRTQLFWGLRWAILVGVGAGVAIGLAGVVRFHESAGNAIVGAVSASALVLLILGVIEFASIRKIELSSDGVRFVYAFQKLLVRWDELRPPIYPYFQGISLGWQPRGAPAPTKWFPLNRRMANAVLDDPRCPRFQLSEDIRKSLR
jgi:hypothetical protein